MTKFIKLAAKLGIKQLADWYYVYKTSIAEHGGSSLLRRFKGNMHEILKQGYPEYLINILIYVRKSILFKKKTSMGWEKVTNQTPTRAEAFGKCCSKIVSWYQKNCKYKKVA